MECINTENKHLHETILFFGNQLNRQLSKSSSTISEDSINSSTLLDDILNELQLSTSKHENVIACRVDRSTNTSQDTSHQCTQRPSNKKSSKHPYHL